MDIMGYKVTSISVEITLQSTPKFLGIHKYLELCLEIKRILKATLNNMEF